MRLATVILHYGNPNLTKRVHKFLLGQPTARNIQYPIFVFDNGAPEPYPEAWERNELNLYWAGALAYCISKIKEMGFTHLWFLNNDIMFIDAGMPMAKACACIQQLEKRIEMPIGIWSPSMVYNTYHPQMCHKKDYCYSQVRLVDGVAPLYNLSCLETIGGVDANDNPYGYGVDLWISLRAANAGWLLIVDHRITIRHIQQATARRIDGFIELAAATEDSFFQKRIGENWKNTIEELKQQNITIYS